MLAFLPCAKHVYNYLDHIFVDKGKNKDIQFGYDLGPITCSPNRPRLEFLRQLIVNTIRNEM